MHVTATPRSREGSTWEWELTAPARAKTGTGVLFRHYGFADGYAEIDLAHTAQTWALILHRLAAYCATGSPQPFFPRRGVIPRELARDWRRGAQRDCRRTDRNRHWSATVRRRLVRLGPGQRGTRWYQEEASESVEWKTPKPLAVGSRIAFVAHFLGRRLAYTYEVKELTAGERLVQATMEGPFPMETTYTWADSSGGRHQDDATATAATRRASQNRWLQ